MENKIFEMKKEHIKLLRKANISWNDAENGAPTIDPKRPYGNSDINNDIIDILELKIEKKIIVDGKEYIFDEEDDNELPDELIDYLSKLHEETETALQIFLQTGQFIPGLYEEYDYEWNLKV